MKILKNNLVTKDLVIVLNNFWIKLPMRILKFLAYLCLVSLMLYFYVIAFDPYENNDAILVGRFMSGTSIFVLLLYRFLIRKDDKNNDAEACIQKT